MPDVNRRPLLEVKDVSQRYKKSSGEEGSLVLDGISLTVDEGEIVGLLGRSGCGKSSLLRLVAGLTRPAGGDIVYRGKSVDGPAEGVAMVFQSAALFPWLSVIANVEIGLRALRVPEEEAHKRALAAIDLIGLDDDQRGALGAQAGIGLGHDNDQIGGLAIGDEGLLAIDAIVVAVLLGGGLDPLQVRSGARFGHGDGADQFARGQTRQPALLLFL